MAQTLRAAIIGMNAENDKIEITLDDVDFTVYYDERPSRGDYGGLVPNSVTGDYEVAVGPLIGGEGVIFRQHVSPTGQGSDTKAYAADQVVAAIWKRLHP